MSGDVFDQNDAAVWEAIGGDERDLHQTDGEGDTVEVSTAALEKIKDRLTALERRVERLEQDDSPTVRESMSTLQKYAKMVEGGMDESIGATDRRAVAIYRNWADLKERLGNGNYGVTTRRNSTKKNQPNQFKLEVQQITGEDLEWEQIYRAMKAVAKLSGGEPEQTQYGRTKIVGGIYEYHERTTPDNSATYKVLIET